jgi:hypothetical protein
MKIFFLEQSRRDNTREALITPHKATAAVWGEDAATVAAS